MIINSLALKRPATVLLLLVIILVAGLSSYFSLPRESFPDISIPYVFVTTSYEGVSPPDMETLITIPLERKLKGLNDVEEIRSTSAEAFSTVAIKFLPNVDIEKALQKVKDKVDQAKKDLPQDLPNDPSVTEVNFSEFPVIRVNLSGPFSLRRLKSLADDIEEKIESLPGVLDARLSGGLEREIHVEFNLDRVRAYNVPFSSIIAAVQRSNVNMPGGSMNIGSFRYNIRVPEDFKDPAEIFSLVAFVRNGKPVYLRDVAEIKDSYREPRTRARINGENSVTLAVMKRTGQNIIEVSDAVRATMEEMRPKLPPALQIDLTSDMAKDIRRLVADLENNILSGLFLVLVVIFLFIGGRSAIFVALAIPYSMLLTFTLLTGWDVTLNMVVLFALILALGMLVDNGIVIVENIYRHMQEGLSKKEAAQVGTDEVAWPVISSTLTTLGAFVPLLFWEGIMGEFMKFIPMTLIMALSSSLLVALVINPVLSAKFQTIRRSARQTGSAEVKLGLIKRFYIAMLKVALRMRIVIVMFFFSMLILVVFLFSKSGLGTEFFPSTEPERAYVYIKAPEGTNLNASDKIVAKVEKIVSQYEDIEYVIANIGSGSGGNIFASGGTGTHISRVVLDFKPFHERSRPSTEIIDEIREKILSTVEGAELQVEKENMGPPTGAAVNIELTGPEIEKLGELAEMIRKAIKPVPGLIDLRDNFVHGKPEIRIKVDKEKAALMGLDTWTIAYTIKSAINGVKIGNFRQGKDEYPIIAKLPEKDRQSLESLNRITISGPMGKPIPITSVAKATLTSGVGSISRLNQKRVVTITGGVSGRQANDVVKDIEKILQKTKLPNGYTYKFTGEQSEQKKTQQFLVKAFVATIFLIFIILVTQFNSIITPLIVLTSVLLSLIGVFTGLLILRMPFGIVMTGIGVISLAGVVVNNAIVLIDYYHKLMERGMSSIDALIQAGSVRLRPVLLTAITTVLGLLPMAIGVSFNFRGLEWEIGGESSQMWSPMAVAVIFGLGIATLLTLIVVPVLCSLAYTVFGVGKNPDQPPVEKKKARKKQKPEDDSEDEILLVNEITEEDLQPSEA